MLAAAEADFEPRQRRIRHFGRIDRDLQETVA
jgi:hypothetical protein